MTELFEKLGSRPNWETYFIKTRLRRLDENEVFSFDATTIATQALQIEDARDSKGEKSEIRRRINMGRPSATRVGCPFLLTAYPVVRFA